MNATARIAIVVAAALALAASAGGGVPAPSQFVARVDNPWFPLAPGSVYVYRGVKDGKAARDVVTVTHRTKRIQGVPCVVVEDRLFLGGRLAERTTDWYAQDRAGNVWYFGESTAELDKRGRVTSTEGSWQAGRDGAVAGSTCRRIRARADRQAGVPEGRGGGSLPRRRPPRDASGAVRDVAERSADRGVDAARAGRPRPQALRARARASCSSGRQGRRRAARARLLHR